MTNNNTHQLNALFLSRKSHTNIVHQMSPSVPVPAVQCVGSGEVARLPRTHTLDVSEDTSRVSARQPLSPAGEWRIDRPTHKEQSLPSHIRYGTKAGKRPDSATNITNTAARQKRGVRNHPEMTPPSQENAERPLRGVRQDKDRFSSDQAASLQPAVVNKFTPSQATSRKSARLQKENSNKPPRAVPVQVWVSPLVKDELSRIASQDGLSLSAAGAALLTRGLQQNVDMQYGALLRPIIEDAIAKQMAGIATRLTWLLVRIAFDAGQTRCLVTNILGRQKGVTDPILKTLMDNSNRSAKVNIMRRTPQISELISSVEQWMLDASRGVSNKKTHD